MTSRIPLFKAKSLGFERDMASFSIKYGTLPNFTASAIVDTGCPYIIISESQIKKTRIPYKDKPSLAKPLSLGKIALELKDLGICEIFFRDEDNKTIAYKESIYVGIPINLSQGDILIQQLPSFIGKEFLDKNYLSVIKARDNKTYLHVIE